MMKIIVGTENKRKLAAVEAVVGALGIVDTYTLHGCAAASGVPETPFGIQTLDGARNRARNSLTCEPTGDLYIGIESGLVERYGNWFEEVWAAAYYRNYEYIAYSSGVVLPAVVAQALTPDVQNHPAVMDTLRKKVSITTHADLGVDTWGNYTGEKLRREEGLEEAVRNVLVQIFPGDTSFYLL